jgi:hypothetical protein
MMHWEEARMFAREAAEAARLHGPAPGRPPRERLGAALGALARRLAPAGGAPSAGPSLPAGGAEC